MAFKVPGEFSDVFIGSVHSMSCLGVPREVRGPMGQALEAVLPFWWPALAGAGLGLGCNQTCLWPDTLVGDLPGRPLLWLEVTWPEAQPEFAGLGLAVCCVEAGFGGCGGSRFPSCAGLQDVWQQLVGALQRNWCVFETTLGGVGWGRADSFKGRQGLDGIEC